MEDVRAVAMALYARLLIQRGVAVAADMVAFIDDGDRLLHHRGDTLGDDRSPDSCANYNHILPQKVIYPSKTGDCVVSPWAKNTGLKAFVTIIYLI